MESDDFLKIINLHHGKIDEAHIIAELERAVIEWLEYRVEEFFSKLYRLDIDEGKIKQALATNEPAQGITLLIYRRQLEKIKSRADNPAADAPDDLRW